MDSEKRTDLPEWQAALIAEYEAEVAQRHREEEERERAHQAALADKLKTYCRNWFEIDVEPTGNSVTLDGVIIKLTYHTNTGHDVEAAIACRECSQPATSFHGVYNRAGLGRLLAGIGANPRLCAACFDSGKGDD